MNCREARDAMLVADMEELSGSGTSDLAAHLGACAECAGIARVLSRDLSGMRSAIVVRRRRNGKRIALGLGVPIAIAAGVATVLFVPRHEAVVSPASVNRPPMNVVSVDAGPGQVPMVIGTSDPNVTIVLLNPGDAP